MEEILQFEEIYSRYNSLVQSLCRKFFQNKEDIEDVSQDIWLKIYKNLSSITDNITNWIYTVAKNTIISIYKKDKNKIEFTTKDGVLPEEPIEEKMFFLSENNKQINLIYKDHRIDADHKDSFLKFAIEGFSIQEIAILYNQKINTIKSWIKRTREYFLNKIYTLESRKSVTGIYK